MADKNVQLKDALGNLVYPKTKAAIVYNDSNEALGGVEAGAQVNKIETIKLNGVEVSIVNKAVDIVVDAQSVYTIAKQETAETGYAATYYLTKDAVQVGEKINIPKDMVVQSGSVKTCEEADNPVEGYKVGDKYIDLLLANTDNQHVYILVKDLVDTYTAGNGITITNNVIAIDDDVVVNHTEFTTELGKKQDSLSETQLAAVNSGITSAKVSTYDGYATTIAGKQDALTDAQLLAVNSGITETKVSTYDGYAATIAGKADKATTLAGYGITDGLTYTELA